MMVLVAYDVNVEKPEGRRRFTTAGDTDPITPTEGTGTWVPVPEEALDDTAGKLREALGDAAFDLNPGDIRQQELRAADFLLLAGRQHGRQHRRGRMGEQAVHGLF